MTYYTLYLINIQKFLTKFKESRKQKQIVEVIKNRERLKNYTV